MPTEAERTILVRLLSGAPADIASGNVSGSTGANRVLGLGAIDRRTICLCPFEAVVPTLICRALLQLASPVTFPVAKLICQIMSPSIKLFHFG